MQLDLRTLVISLMLVAGVNSLVMLLAWRYTSSMRNITGFWSVSQLLFLLGTALLALRYAIPDFFSIVVCNVLLLGGQVALQEGLGYWPAWSLPRLGVKHSGCTVWLGVFFYVFSSFLRMAYCLLQCDVCLPVYSWRTDAAYKWGARRSA